MQVVKQSLYKARKRINFDSLLHINNVGDNYSRTDYKVVRLDNLSLFKHLIEYNRAFTISFFFVIESFNNEKYQHNCFFSRGENLNSGSDYRGWTVFIRGNGGVDKWSQLQLTLSRTNVNETVALVYSHPSQFQLNTLYHACICYDYPNTDYRLYVNGVNNSSINFSNFQYNSINDDIDAYPLEFGKTRQLGSSRAMNPFNGYIGHITFFNRAIEEKEVFSILKAGGIILEDELKKSCVAHFIPQPGAPKLWDVVEIYNSSKDLYSYSFSYGTNFQGNDGFTPGSLISSGFRVPWQGSSHNTYFLPTYGEFELTISILLTYSIWRVKLYNDDTGILYEQFDHTNSGSNQLKTFSFYIVGIKNLRIEIQSVGATQAGALMELRKLTITRQPSKAFHGQYINFTPQELGLDNFSRQVAFKDIYTKHNILPYGFHFPKGFGGQYVNIIFDNQLNHEVVSIGGDWTVEVDAINYYTQSFGTGQKYLFRISDLDIYIDMGIYQSHDCQIKIGGNWHVLPDTAIGMYNPKRHHFVLTYDASIQEVKVYFNTLLKLTFSGDFGFTVTTPSVTFPINGTGNGGRYLREAVCNYLNIWKDRCTHDQIIKMYQGETVPLANQTIKVNYSQLYGYDFLEQISGQKFVLRNWGSYTAFSDPNSEYYKPELGLPGSDYYVEKSSLMPPLAHALKFNRADNQKIYVENFYPTGEKGYTFVFALQFVDYQPGTTYYIMTKRSGENNYNSGASGQSYLIINFQDTQKLRIRLQKINSNAFTTTFDVSHLDLNKPHLFEIYANSEDSEGRIIRLNVDVWDEITYKNTTGSTMATLDMLDSPFYIGGHEGSQGNAFNGYMFFARVLKGKLSRKYAMQIWNNSLLANPKKEWTIDWHLWLNFNQIIDDTAVSGNYLIKDWGIDGNNSIIQNYTVNQITPTCKEYQIIPINNLRDNEIHHIFSGDTVSAMSEQVNLLDGTTFPTNTYIFEGTLPSGLSLSTSGALTGTVIQTGTFSLLVRLMNENNNFEYKKLQLNIV